MGKTDRVFDILSRFNLVGVGASHIEGDIGGSMGSVGCGAIVKNKIEIHGRKRFGCLVEAEQPLTWC